jgi:hypothetical protein
MESEAVERLLLAGEVWFCYDIVPQAAGSAAADDPNGEIKSTIVCPHSFT